MRKPWDADTVPLSIEAGGWQVVGPTTEPYRQGSHVPAALDQAGSNGVVAEFVQTTERCGFDLVELHGAHGFLMHSFYSHISNTRTDGYGGSVAGRMRLALEIASAEYWSQESLARVLSPQRVPPQKFDLLVMDFNLASEQWVRPRSNWLASGCGTLGCLLLPEGRAPL